MATLNYTAINSPSSVSDLMVTNLLHYAQTVLIQRLLTDSHMAMVYVNTYEVHTRTKKQVA